MSGPKSAQMVLQNPTVDTAVFEVARGGILREGLGYDRNDVAVVTNVTGDHLGLGGIDSLGSSRTSRVWSWRPCRAPGPRCSTPTIRTSLGWVGIAPAGSSTSAWRPRRARTASTGSTGTRARRRGVLPGRPPEGELIVLRLGSRTMPVLYTHLIPATFGGRARMNVANALGAAAAAWAAGAHLHDIRQGLRTFSTSFFQAPGRLNLLDVGGVRVVIDYCHNVDGMRKLADFVESDDGRARRRRRIGAKSGTRPRPGGRSACSASRATGATRTSGSTAAIAATARSTRSSCARTSTCAVERRGSRRGTRDRGRPRGRGRARPDDAGREGARRDDRRPGRPRRARSRRPRGHVRRRRDRRSIARRWPLPGRRAAGRPSRIPGSSRPRRVVVRRAGRASPAAAARGHGLEPSILSLQAPQAIGARDERGTSGSPSRRHMALSHRSRPRALDVGPSSENPLDAESRRAAVDTTEARGRGIGGRCVDRGAEAVGCVRSQ